MYYINLSDIIKLLCIIFLLYLIYFKNIYIYNIKNIIDIDNIIDERKFEEDLDFSKYKTDLKIIAIYYPYYLKKDFAYFNKNTFERNINIKTLTKKEKKVYKNLYLRNEKNLTQLIKEQIYLARNHGIYGFGINYYWFPGKAFDNKQIDLFLDDKDVNYPFFLIWNNDEKLLDYYELKKTTAIIEQEYKKNDITIFINNIRKFLINKNYIKINGKPILAIYDPLIIHNIKEYLSNLRQIAIEKGIGELFLIGTLYNDNNLHCIELFDACFECPPKNLNLNKFQNNNCNYYYQGLIYNEDNNYADKNNKFNLFRGIMLEYNNSSVKKNNPVIFDEYSPEKLYILMKIIINWTSNNHNKDDYFIFINAWNNFEERLYLEPDEYLGYASLNALSRAIFNISFSKYLNLDNIKNSSNIAVQAHIFYEDLIIEIINKTNNIPVKFDLYISTTSVEMKNNVIEFINNYSKSDRYEIIILDNKGRDVLPLLIQLKNKIKYYKYFCHIHSKKSKTSPIIGKNWRNYLLNNLLGNAETVSEILSDFENMDKLGFIYPETFYDIIGLSFILTKKTKKYMKYILRKIFNKVKLGNKLEFPAGNMFWARVRAVYQIFEINFYNKFDKEDDQTNDTIMHGIERIWLYLVKLNRFYYKKIFKSYI